MDLEEVMGLQELEKKKDKFKIMITYGGMLTISNQND